jgi:hypothetical protein
MLIVIDRAHEAQIAVLCATAPLIVLRGITNLLQAYADGRHVVVAPQSICRIWEECGRLSEEQRAVAKKIRARFPELAELRNILAVYAEITLTGEMPSREGSVWKLPLSWIAQHGLAETSLVCEDLYDCEVCHEAARDYLTSASLPKLMLRLDHAAGGGANTGRILRKKAIEDQRVCFCVVDSDRNEPSKNAPVGSTALSCLQVSGDGLYDVCVTDGRELENHLPAKLVDKIRPVWEGSAPSEKYAQITQRCQSMMMFVDLKKGLKRKDIEELSGNARIFWDGAFASLNQPVKCCHTGCSALTAGDCKHSVMTPLNRTLLHDARDYLLQNAKNQKRFREYLPSQNESFWKKVGSLVAAYGVSVKITSMM